LELLHEAIIIRKISIKNLISAKKEAFLKAFIFLSLLMVCMGSTWGWATLSPLF
jgi:hypothetical protein